MKTKHIFLLAFIFFSIKSFGVIHTITSVGTTFNPDSITISNSDTVHFNIGGVHTSTEVSLSTWNANENTPLTNGFETGSGGGFVYPDKLSVGTHYFVCTPHASIGMKGKIVVEDAQVHNGLKDNIHTSFNIYPNPITTKVYVQLSTGDLSGSIKLSVFNYLGLSVYQTLISSATTEIDMSALHSGLYIIQIQNKQEVISQQVVKD